MSVRMIENSYGKSRVRLTKVTRHAERHDLRELIVDVQLRGDFAASYTAGDNRRVIATDSIKNTVYVLARAHPLPDIESFALTLAEHFLGEYAQVAAATVDISEHAWERLAAAGRPDPFAFLRRTDERRTCTASAARAPNGPPHVTIEAGLDELEILKTTHSEFADFVRDRFTTLADTHDRILATVLSARWRYSAGAVDWSACRERVRTAMLATFAAHHSLAVQQTLYAMGEAALAACPQVERVALEMPNRHRLLFDLQRFGLDNPNVIFVPTDEPFGLISATMVRE